MQKENSVEKMKGLTRDLNKGNFKVKYNVHVQ